MKMELLLELINKNNCSHLSTIRNLITATTRRKTSGFAMVAINLDSAKGVNLDKRTLAGTREYKGTSAIRWIIATSICARCAYGGSCGRI